MWLVCAQWAFLADESADAALDYARLPTRCAAERQA